jgi:hypothetical protein
VWRGELTPNPVADTYLVELFAKSGNRQPDVFVLAPELKPDGEGRLPHVWPDGTLCLSKYGEWQGNSLFVETCVPWTAEWLLHYEIWCATGVWMGDAIDATTETTSRILHHFQRPTAGMRRLRSAQSRQRKSNVQPQ